MCSSKPAMCCAKTDREVVTGRYVWDREAADVYVDRCRVLVTPIVHSYPDGEGSDRVGHEPCSPLDGAPSPNAPERFRCTAQRWAECVQGLRCSEWVRNATTTNHEATSNGDTHECPNKRQRPAACVK